MSGSGRMKNGLSVEVDTHPTDVSISTSPDHAAVGVLMGGMDGTLLVGYQRSFENSVSQLNGSHDEQSNRSARNERSRRSR